MVLIGSMRRKLRMNCCARNVEVIEYLTRATGWSRGDEHLIGVGSGETGRGIGNHKKS